MARLVLTVTLLAAITIPFALGTPATVHTAICGKGMAPNPAGYGCVPELSNGTNWPGGGFVGAPSQEVLTRCHGNYYICIWPYPTV